MISQVTTPETFEFDAVDDVVADVASGKIVIVTDDADRFVRFQRLYDASDDPRFARVVLTPDRSIAKLWQNAPDPLAAGDASPAIRGTPR